MRYLYRPSAAAGGTIRGRRMYGSCVRRRPSSFVRALPMNVRRRPGVAVCADAVAHPRGVDVVWVLGVLTSVMQRRKPNASHTVTGSRQQNNPTARRAPHSLFWHASSVILVLFTCMVRYLQARWCSSKITSGWTTELYPRRGLRLDKRKCTRYSGGSVWFFPVSWQVIIGLNRCTWCVEGVKAGRSRARSKRRKRMRWRKHAAPMAPLVQPSLRNILAV